ncbi:hypothetical protein A4D02_35190 [Niastella koreensis]|uniref:Anti-FecI sigma factor, FecR n=2 Tax=Niastella koreensis TaxID=354356 RepID=G8TBR2_NIAKG|nr:FecR family protein [Niastella koreensis]AEV98194.1 anti-FecI sigma factor, FecR [Niastella koreensis GR20-10]OQP44303.1 hypothetical protein A4D02_35190 [Niastella koreensis]
MDEPIDDLLAQGRDEEVKARINTLLQQPAQTPMPPETAAGVLAAIMAADSASNTPVVGLHRSGNWRLYAACAAMVILVLGAGYFWFQSSGFSHKEQQQEKLADKTVNDVQPGGNKAILTLADGTVIDLDKSNNGTIATQGKTAVRKNIDGELEYRDANSPLTTDYSQNNSPAFNTVSTPNGGQYQVVLPDGSRVWLNAASSIRFPASFTGERKITMTGEAYFEVAHNEKMPFIINVNDKEEVTVLGTHFNINAYGNERAIYTTLLQGSVKVGRRPTSLRQLADTAGDAEMKEQSVVLKPGEQAIAIASPLTTEPADSRHPDKVGNSPLTINHSPNLDQTLAWKNGLFNLAGADLKDFMHQVERWYDVTVQYEGAVPNMVFQGKLNRGVPLSDIIDYLKNLGVSCELSGKVLHVKSK